MICVLIVDDDKLARKGLISMMPWSSYDMDVVGEAANGAKALEFLENNHVDLMFVDLDMPVLSGIELIQEVRKHYPEVYYVVLTFYENFEYVQTIFRLGALDYISKVRLDMEDYEQIFSRIQQKVIENNEQKKMRMDRNKSVESNISSSRTDIPLDEEQISQLEKKYRDLYWLFDRTEFQRLCTQLLKTNISEQRMAKLFTRVVSQVEMITHIESDPWYDIKNPQAAIGFIRHYRDLIYSRVAKSTDSGEIATCILKSILYIHDQIATALHADTVADSVNMSRSYFSQCFKKLVGLTFNDYLRQERIMISKDLLCQTKQGISWISQAVGYGDVKYFSIVFREYTKLLPSEFRAQYNRGEVNDDNI
jgi:two-component system response regulator YesN